MARITETRTTLSSSSGSSSSGSSSSGSSGSSGSSSSGSSGSSGGSRGPHPAPAGLHHAIALGRPVDQLQREQQEQGREERRRRPSDGSSGYQKRMGGSEDHASMPWQRGTQTPGAQPWHAPQLPCKHWLGS